MDLLLLAAAGGALVTAVAGCLGLGQVLGASTAGRLRASFARLAETTAPCPWPGVPIGVRPFRWALTGYLGERWALLGEVSEGVVVALTCAALPEGAIQLDSLEAGLPDALAAQLGRARRRHLAGVRWVAIRGGWLWALARPEGAIERGSAPLGEVYQDLWSVARAAEDCAARLAEARRREAELAARIEVAPRKDPPAGLELSVRAAPALECPYCRDALAGGLALVYCQSCGAQQHAECWQEAGGCSIFGCSHGPR